MKIIHLPKKPKREKPKREPGPPRFKWWFRPGTIVEKDGRLWILVDSNGAHMDRYRDWELFQVTDWHDPRLDRYEPAQEQRYWIARYQHAEAAMEFERAHSEHHEARKKS
jgi:hypothetical protein